jgi:hypothetical protein
MPSFKSFSTQDYHYYQLTCRAIMPNAKSKNAQCHDTIFFYSTNMYKLYQKQTYFLQNIYSNVMHALRIHILYLKTYA